MKIKNIFRFASAMLLIVTVLLSSLVFVQAANTIDVTDEASFKEAFEKVGNGDTIEISGIFTVYNPVVTNAKNYTIKGNGTVTFDYKQGLNIQGGNVTIEGVTFKQTDAVSGSDSRLIGIQNAATLTINSGTFEGSITVLDSDNTTNLNINGGTFNQNKGYGIVSGKTGNITIKGGTFKGSVNNMPIIYAHSDTGVPTINIYGGSFTKPEGADGINSAIIFMGTARVSLGVAVNDNGPIMTHNGDSDIIAYLGKSTKEASLRINSAELTHTKSGNIIGFSKDCTFDSLITINGSTGNIFKHTGTGSFIETVKKSNQSSGKITIVNGSAIKFVYSGSGYPFSLSENCIYEFEGINIDFSLNKEIIRIGADIDVLVLSESDIKNKASVINVAGGKAMIYTPESNLQSNGSVISGKNYEWIKDYPPRMLELSYADAADTNAANGYAYLASPGQKYQFNIDYKSGKKEIEPHVNIKYAYYNRKDYTAKIEINNDDITTDGNHMTITFTLPENVRQVEGRRNLIIQLGKDGNKDGKIQYANAELKLLDSSGKPTGQNLLFDGTFSKTARDKGENLPGDTYIDPINSSTWYWFNPSTTSSATFTIKYIDDHFSEPSPQRGDPKMLVLAQRKNEDHKGVEQLIEIESGKTYVVEVDKKAVGGAEVDVQLFQNNELYKDAATKFDAINVGSKYTCKFIATKNILRLRVYRIDASKTGDDALYVSNITLCELKADGTKGENLVFNGDFAYGKIGAVTDENQYDQLYGWECTDDHTWADEYKKVELQDIPDDYFKPEYALHVQQAKGGNVSVVETVAKNKKYIFSYSYMHKTRETATPYIKEIDSNGKLQDVKIISTEYNTNNKSNITVVFETNSNLRNTKNLQVGVEVPEGANGWYTDFSLTEADAYNMPKIGGSNLITNGRFENYKDGQTTKIYAYEDSVDTSVWFYNDLSMFTGSTLPERTYATSDWFAVKKPQVFIVSGRNKSGEEYYGKQIGEDGVVEQSVNVTKEKTYRVSYNAKWAGTGIQGDTNGETDKANIVVTYKGKEIACTESKTEYKWVGEFVADGGPEAVKNNPETVKIQLNIDSAYVSGHFANFSLVEITEIGGTEVDGQNLLTNGDFANGNLDGWNQKGNLYQKKFGEMPENYFSKKDDGDNNFDSDEYNTRMLTYSSTDDWAAFSQHFMIKPETSYEIRYHENHYIQVESAASNFSMAHVYNEYDEHGNIVDHGNEAIGGTIDALKHVTPKIDDGNGYVKRIFTTTKDAWTCGDGNAYVRLWMRKNTAGYWGEITIYELDSNGNRVGNNILLNPDFGLGFAGWEQTKSGNYYITEQPNKTYIGNAPNNPKDMIYSNGKENNAFYGQNVTIDAYKTYRLSCKKVDMNGEGVNGEIWYKSRANGGKYTRLSSENYTVIYDAQTFEYVLQFTIPSDAVIVNQKVEIRAGVSNGKGGTGYFTKLSLNEYGQAENLIPNPTGSKKNYIKQNYNDKIFEVYLDDTKFSDGNWSGEAETGDDGPDYEEIPSQVKGTVLDASGSPIKGMKLILKGADKDRTTTTDANGNFIFKNLPEGTYSLYLVDANGNEIPIATGFYIGNGTIATIPTITYTEGLALLGDGLDLEMPEEEEAISESYQGPYGALRGYLYTASGTPVNKAMIWVRDYGYAVTNEEGMFQFDRLPVGEQELYTIMANNEELVLKKVVIEANKGKIVRLYLPGNGSSFNWLIVIIPAAVILLSAAGVVIMLLLKKKKEQA